jgi:16S rRNA (cytosine1402-N4)-methyltransferase
MSKHKRPSKPRKPARIMQQMNDGKERGTRTDADGVEITSKNAGSYHVPVMLKECCDALVTDPNATYIDGTLGGGGHSAEILRRLDVDGHLIAFDEDSAAITRAKERFGNEIETIQRLENGIWHMETITTKSRTDGITESTNENPSPHHDHTDHSRMTLCHANFSFACSIKRDGKPQAQEDYKGILLDLGVSSRQLDTGGIGLSYRVNSHLDMRFGSRDVPSAAELIATTEQEALERILRLYGEEPFAQRIARRIVDVRRLAPVVTTFDLRTIVEESVPPQHRQQSLSRVFQAFRIAVNRELDVLEETLRGIVPRLQTGGRIVVLSYHSLEDRIVKTVFHELSRRSVPIGHPLDTSPNHGEAIIKSLMKEIEPKLKVLTKKPLAPSDEEISINYRARSAKLRIAEKL